MFLFLAKYVLKKREIFKKKLQIYKKKSVFYINLI